MASDTEPGERSTKPTPKGYPMGDRLAGWLMGRDRKSLLKLLRRVGWIVFATTGALGVLVEVDSNWFDEHGWSTNILASVTTGAAAAAIGSWIADAVLDRVSEMRMVERRKSYEARVDSWRRVTGVTGSVVIASLEGALEELAALFGVDLRIGEQRDSATIGPDMANDGTVEEDAGPHRPYVSQPQLRAPFIALLAEVANLEAAIAELRTHLDVSAESIRESTARQAPNESVAATVRYLNAFHTGRVSSILERVQVQLPQAVARWVDTMMSRDLAAVDLNFVDAERGVPGVEPIATTLITQWVAVEHAGIDLVASLSGLSSEARSYAIKVDNGGQIVRRDAREWMQEVARHLTDNEWIGVHRRTASFTLASMRSALEHSLAWLRALRTFADSVPALFQDALEEAAAQREIAQVARLLERSDLG